MKNSCEKIGFLTDYYYRRISCPNFARKQDTSSLHFFSVQKFFIVYVRYLPNSDSCDEIQLKYKHDLFKISQNHPIIANIMTQNRKQTRRTSQRACLLSHFMANGCQNRPILWYLDQMMIGIDLNCNINPHTRIYTTLYQQINNIKFLE